MTYEELNRVNSEIKTTPIKGKNYAAVAGRVAAFRKLYPNGAITNDIVSLSGEMGKRTVVMKATVKDEFGVILSTGYAFEDEANGMVNKTSFIENCDTSAIGRALGFLGIGDTEIASAEEVETAREIQTANGKINEVKQKAIATLIEESGLKLGEVLSLYKVTDVKDLTERQHENIVNHISDIKEMLS